MIFDGRSRTRSDRVRYPGIRWPNSAREAVESLQAGVISNNVESLDLIVGQEFEVPDSVE